MKKGIIIGSIIILAVIVVAIFIFPRDNADSSTFTNLETINAKEKLWWNTELKNVNNGETFRISDFEGKPILLESFAIWCPVCTRQQQETKKLDAELGDSVISISLDTDPNEDEDRLLEHTTQNGFDWYYAVSPSDMTRALIDDFGVEIVNAPSVPVVLICEDGSARILDSGLKNVAELKAELATCGS